MTLREFRNALWELAAHSNSHTVVATVAVVGQMGAPDRVTWTGTISGYREESDADPKQVIERLRQSVRGLDDVGEP